MAAPAAVAATNSRRFIGITISPFILPVHMFTEGVLWPRIFSIKEGITMPLKSDFPIGCALCELRLYLIDEDHLH
jgi:hypothetical protein